MSDPDAERNYYVVLGASEDASQVEIERIYKRLARQHHPDRGGSAEKMKVVNEAYRVLGNEAARRAYDEAYRVLGDETARRAYDMHRPQPQTFDQRHEPQSFDRDVPPFSILPTLLEDTFSGRLAGAMWWLMGGLVFLFVVEFFYLRFLWPVFAFAAIVVLFGVWKIRAALVFGRKSLAASHPLRRYVWVQEAAFWLVMSSGAYGVYLVMLAI